MLYLKIVHQLLLLTVLCLLVCMVVAEGRQCLSHSLLECSAGASVLVNQNVLCEFG